MRRVALLPLLLAVPLVVPAPAAACHPVPDPAPPGYRDHGCGDTGKGGAAQAVTSVSVGDDFFEPSPVRIQPGEAVRWVWASGSSNQHNVAADPGQSESFKSAFLAGAGKSYSHTFSKPGRFTYFCEIHANSMRGVVEVGSAPFPDTRVPRARSLAARVTGATAKLSFRLSENARVRAVLARPQPQDDDQEPSQRQAQHKLQAPARRQLQGHAAANRRAPATAARP